MKFKIIAITLMLLVLLALAALFSGGGSTEEIAPEESFSSEVQ
jgi:hypothetical protein